MIKDLKNIILGYLDYTEEYRKVMNELKIYFKVYKMFLKNNHMTKIYINHYIYYNNDN